MKIELYIDGPAACAAFAAFVPLWQEAITADRGNNGWYGVNPVADMQTAPLTPVGEAEQAAKAEAAEKPKRGSRKAAEPAPEPAPNITATPEAREPVVEPTPEPEPAKEITADDIRTALNAIVAKFGMPYATSNVQRLLGAPKVGAVDPATYPEVLARLEAELAVEDING